MKNHKMVNGKLLQTNKKFAALKTSQKEKIQNWLLEEYLGVVHVHNRLLTQEEKDAVVSRVYDKIEQADIWIPYQEVTICFRGKLTKWNKKYIV